MIFLKLLTEIWLPKPSEQDAHVLCARLYVPYVLILEREENQSTRRKTVEAQERSTMRNLTHMKCKPDLAWLFQW